MKASFTLILVFFAVTAFAQRNLVPGYYVTKDGERVEAQINDLNWDRNPAFIEVVKGNGLQRLGVADINGFGISSGDVFDVFVVDVDKSPTKLNDIIPNSQPVIERDTVFLRAIVKGAASLYYLKDEDAKEHYYIRKGKEEPAELIYRTTKYESNGKSGYTKLPVYKGLLTSMLTGCPDVTGKVSKLNYTRKALADFVTEYNQCLGTNGFVYKSSEEVTKWKFSAIGGVSFTSLSFKSSEFKALTNSDFSNMNYTGGLSVLATLPRGRGKWAVQGDVLFRNLVAEGSYTESSSTSNENYKKTDTRIDMGYASLNTSVRYRLNDNKLRAYVSAGVSNSLMLYDNSKQEIYRKFYSSEDTTEQAPLEETRKLEQALLLGVGVEMNKLAAEVKLESGNGFSPYVGLKTARNAVSVMLRYTLK